MDKINIIQNIIRKMSRKRNHLGKTGVDEGIILKQEIFKVWDERIW
jgi:hypothetical protein